MKNLYFEDYYYESLFLGCLEKSNQLYFTFEFVLHTLCTAKNGIYIFTIIGSEGEKVGHQSRCRCMFYKWNYTKKSLLIKFRWMDREKFSINSANCYSFHVSYTVWMNLRHFLALICVERQWVEDILCYFLRHWLIRIETSNINWLDKTYKATRFYNGSTRQKTEKWQ